MPMVDIKTMEGRVFFFLFCFCLFFCFCFVLFCFGFSYIFVSFSLSCAFPFAGSPSRLFWQLAKMKKSFDMFEIYRDLFCKNSKNYDFVLKFCFVLVFLIFLSALVYYI